MVKKKLKMDRSKKKLPLTLELEKCHEDGATAFHQSKGEEACPHEGDGSGKRQAWFHGYLEARSSTRLATLFAKYPTTLMPVDLSRYPVVNP